jgi:hypothetical protein|tara:strand:+ start:562 stop:762 length:201 start_codon:yes stop_codon:yes gene_type:complete
MDNDIGRMVHFLQINGEATDLDFHLMQIHDIKQSVKKAISMGHPIQTKTTGILWSKNTIYYMKKQK